MEHTKLPWSYEHRKKKNGMYSTEVFCNEGQTIATLAWYSIPTDNGFTTNREANAAFIVKACNCHDELLKAAKEALSIIEKYSDVPVHIFALKEAIAKAEA